MRSLLPAVVLSLLAVSAAACGDEDGDGAAAPASGAGQAGVGGSASNAGAAGKGGAAPGGKAGASGAGTGGAAGTMTAGGAAGTTTAGAAGASATGGQAGAPLGGAGGAANGGTSGKAGNSGSAGSSAGSAGSAGKAGGAGKAGAGGGSGQAGNAQGGQAGNAQGGSSSGADPVVIVPKSGLDADELGLLVNDDDPQSVAVAAYYQKARGIPEAHTYHLKLGAAKLGGTMTAADFDTKIAKPLAKAVPASIQGYAVSWSGPLRVDCMSLPTALALGFDQKYCHAPPPGQACGTTAPSGYYGKSTVAPFTDAKIRPTMMLAGTSVANVTALIDRGVAADGSFPDGDGYFVRTTDGNRSVRFGDFQATVANWNPPAGALSMTYLDSSKDAANNTIKNKTDVLFYLTGLQTVGDITTNTYRPGAVADHLTSFGGLFAGSGQMSVLRWLEAGLTASYGTAFEPCNYETKFPRASMLVSQYFRGATVLEAYWKSVDWPGEGVFVGEPLAKPWGTKTSFDQATQTLTIVTTVLAPNKPYLVESAEAQAGPWSTVKPAWSIAKEKVETIVINDAKAGFYRLRAQ